MRIVIDMQGVQNGSRFRGIGRYINAFVKHLIQVAQGDDIVLAFSAGFPETIDPLRGEYAGLVGSDNIHVWQPVTPAHFADARNTPGRLASELIREAFLVALRPDVILLGSLFEGCRDDVITSIGRFPGGAPVAVIFYDLIPYLYPEAYLGNHRLREWYGGKLTFLKNARMLLAISHSAANEVVSHLGIDRENITVISSAAEAKFRTERGVPEPELRDRFAISRPYLLYTGAADARKNLPGLLEAFSRLPQGVLNRFQLVLAGAISPTNLRKLRKLSAELKLPENGLRFLGHVTDEELIGLYRAAWTCVMPSFHEGFGLPVLEAMNCGTPVIGSNTSSIPEAIGLEEALFNPRSSQEMALVIERVLVDEPFRNRLIEHGNSHRERFSWEASASRELAALRKIVKQSSSTVPDALPSDAGGIMDVLIPLLGRALAENGAMRADFIKTAEALEASFMK